VTEAFQTPGLSIKVKEMKGPIVEGEVPRCREVRYRIAKQMKIQ
jgi:hypothetical protein